VLLVLLAVTGVALNHSGALGLDRYYLAAPWLLERYRIPDIEIGASFAVDGRRVTAAGGRQFLDAVAIDAAGIDALAGAVAVGDEIALAAAAEVVLVNRSAELIDRLAVGLYLPGPIEAIAAAADGIWLSSDGRNFYVDMASGAVSLPDPTAAQPGSPAPAWVESSPPPASLTTAIELAYRGNGVSAERLLLDLHSGRLFGLSGTLLTDLAASALGLLAISGLAIWLRR
jgi:uncharacterized iron-regulated membrane protein